jgi:hypothetical protein
MSLRAARPPCDPIVLLLAGRVKRYAWDEDAALRRRRAFIQHNPAVTIAAAISQVMGSPIGL